MHAEVEINEGGQTVRKERMKLKLVKQFSDDITIYENEDGRAVLYFKSKEKYMLISIDMA
jgi:hypothetical protein